MATISQIDANRENAKSSTGPRTPEGKQTAAQNGITTGLFTSRDFSREEEREDYTAFAAQYRLELAPAGIIENTLATKILSAAWRLRRCLIAEAESDVTEAQQKSIDRARAAAHLSMRRNMAELRRVQADKRRDRQAAIEAPAQRPAQPQKWLRFVNPPSRSPEAAAAPAIPAKNRSAAADITPRQYSEGRLMRL